jgi:hypothetical protein
LGRCGFADLERSIRLNAGCAKEMEGRHKLKIGLGADAVGGQPARECLGVFGGEVLQATCP